MSDRYTQTANQDAPAAATTTPPANHDPADCSICGHHAIGVGLESRNGYEPRWLCSPCSLLAVQIREMRRPDAYDLKAREGGMEAAGAFIEKYGSDLGEYSEDQALMLVGAIWDGCSDRIRQLIKGGGAPF